MRRDYKGAAQAAKLTLQLGGSTADLTIYCDDLTNWPTGANSRPFYVVIDRGKASEEKILCASRTSNVITVYNSGGTNGRAADGTSITAHSANAVIEHVFTATDADEANAHVNTGAAVHGLSGSVVGTTDTQTLTNKTLTTPTIGSFTNATHTHANAAGGGTITVAAVSDIASNYAPLNLSINAQTGTSYTLVIGDAGKQVEMNNGSANTLTIPLNSSVAFPIGTTILVLQTGAGQTTIAGASGVTLNSTPGAKLRTQWSGATLIKRGTDSWVLMGDVSA